MAEAKTKTTKADKGQEKLSDADVAEKLLAKQGEPIHYKELIMKVIELQKRPVQSISALISQIYTTINMDSRFHYEGKGMWGLTLWVPPEVKRGHAKTVAKQAAQEKDTDEAKLESSQE